jgi:UDP-glucose 4-epimerase
LGGRGSCRLVPLPPERKRIDIGDFYADTTKIRRALGWEPRVVLRAGLEQTLAFYRAHQARYL